MKGARVLLEYFMVDKECSRDAVFALHMVGSDDIGRWEGAGTPHKSATVSKISKNLKKT